jgi:putative FmdB family regulatory protein
MVAGEKSSMPIFEYKCEECGKRFEAIVIGSRKPECPSCHSKKLEQQLSSFAVGASSSSTPCGAPAGSCGNAGGGT